MVPVVPWACDRAARGGRNAGQTERVVAVATIAAPVAGQIPDQTAIESVPFACTVPGGVFYDPNGDPLVLTAARGDGAAPRALPAGMTLDVADRTYTEEREIAPPALPEAAGGNGGPLTYELTSEPAGLRFDPETRVLSGAPDRHGRLTFTDVAHDADANRELSDAAVLTFAVTVREAPCRRILRPVLAAIGRATLYDDGFRSLAVELHLCNAPRGLDVQNILAPVFMKRHKKNHFST